MTNQNSKDSSAILYSNIDKETETSVVSPRPELDSVHAYIIAILVGLVQFSIMGTYTAYPALLTLLQQDSELQHPTQTTLSSVQSIILAMVPTVGVGAGWACDRFGTRPVVLTAGIALLAMTQLTPWIGHYSTPAFITVYSLTMGLSCACITAPGPAALGSWFSPQKVSFGIGIGEAGVALGTAVMPELVSVLVTRYKDWRTVLHLLGIVSIIPIVLSYFITQRTATTTMIEGGNESRHVVDQIRAEEKTGQPHQEGKKVTVNARDPLLLQNIVYGDEGINAESDSNNNQQPQQSVFVLLKTRNCLVLVFAQCFFAFAYFGLLFIGIPLAQSFGKTGTKYETYTKISLEGASALLTAFGIASVVGTLLLGALAAKLNNRLIFTVSCALLMLCFIFWAISTTYAELMLLFCSMGFLFAGGLACLPAMVVEKFLGPHLNTLMSVSFGGFGVGGLLGPPVFSAIQSASSKGSYNVSIFIGAASLGLGAASVWLLTPEVASTEEEN